MFWRITGLSTASPVETILDKEDYTLEELLDEDEIIQECKALNSRLINFLRETTQVEQLLRYIVEESPEDAEKKRTFKFPYMACEIFTCEVDVILRTLVESDELMNLLFSFIQPDHSHATILAGYFSKVVICLMLRKAVPFMNYIQRHREIIHQLVDLIGITSIMEVLIRLIGADDHMYSNYMDATPWLEDMNILEMIVDKFSSSDSPEVHANAAEILCAITRYAPPGLAAKISSPNFVGRLFCHALEESRPKSVLIHSLTICISLLDPKRQIPTPYYSFRSQLSHGPSITANPETVDGMLESLADLLKLLDNSSSKNSLPTTYGSLQPPLGKHRLKIVEFISVLLTIGNEAAEKELIRLGALECVLDLFFGYPFNNFLHHHVENIIMSCLESRQSLLTEHLLECKLVDKILEAEKNSILSSETAKPTKSVEGRVTTRIGNIGHLTRIANKLVQLSSNTSIIQTHLQENNEWVNWQSNELLKRNAVENVYQWGCGRPSTLQDRSRDSDDEDNRDRDYDISAPDDYVDSGLASLRLGDDTDRSLITNSNWFAFDTDRFVNEQPTSSFFSPTPLLDEIDEVVVGENDELLDTATSSQFHEAGDDSEPGSVVLVNGPIKESEASEYSGSPLPDSQTPPEWIEWRETSEKNDIADSQTVPKPLSDSQTTPTPLPDSQTTPTSLPDSQTTPTSLPDSQTTPTSLPDSQTSPTTLPDSETAPTPLPNSETAPTPLPDSETAPTPLPDSETAPKPIPDSETAPKPLPDSETAPKPLPDSLTAPKPLPDSEATPTQLPNGVVEDVEDLVTEKIVTDTTQTLEPSAPSNDDKNDNGGASCGPHSEAEGSLKATVTLVSHLSEPKSNDGCSDSESSCAADANVVSN